MKYKILNLLAFCLWNDKYVAIANDGYFASTAWRESDEKFDSIIGRSFGWYDPVDGCTYKDDKSIFTRPTEEQVLDALATNEVLQREALKQNLIEVVDLEVAS